MSREPMTIRVLATAAVSMTLIAGCMTRMPPASSPAARTPAGVPVILDTDIGTDVDDAGALAVLHALASRGEARILAVMSSNRNPWSGAAIDVISTCHRRGKGRESHRVAQGFAVNWNA